MRALYKKINFDAEKDFAPISLIGSQANILVVNPALPARSMAELIALAKANPGKLNFASSGYGAGRASRRRTVQGARRTIDIVHVAYKGAAPALQDVIAGHVQMMFATAASVVGHIRDGLVRPLAVTTLKRTAVLPDIPTDRRARHSGFRRDHLARPGRAGRHAAGGDRDAASRARHGARTIRRCTSRLPISGSISSARRRPNSPPTSRPKSRNGARSCRRPEQAGLASMCGA